MNWQPIETAPKDGTAVLLLSKGQQPKCAIGYWDSEGDSWCDQYGRFPDHADFDTDTMALHVTGFWASGGGWFQPNEVSHWMPLPHPPENV